MYLEITAPTGVLGLVRMTLPKGTVIEFERTATIPGRSNPSLRISEARSSSTIAGFRDSRFVDEVSLVAETEDECVYQLSWGERLPDIIEQVRNADGAVMSAIAEMDQWTFELRFPSHEAASQFYTRYEDHDHPITIVTTRSTESAADGGNEVLTPRQRDAIGRALEAGYFEVPRRTTLVELASELGISDSAVSQRLRRGVLNVLNNTSAHPVAVSHSAFDDND